MSASNILNPHSNLKYISLVKTKFTLKSTQTQKLVCLEIHKNYYLTSKSYNIHVNDPEQ